VGRVVSCNNPARSFVASFRLEASIVAVGILSVFITLLIWLMKEMALPEGELLPQPEKAASKLLRKEILLKI
jgi:hypothetical protein